VQTYDANGKCDTYGSGDCDAYNYYVKSSSKYCKDCFSPGSFSNKCTLGCGAVAMGQVMYYWKYPMDYDWCNMVDELKTYSLNYNNERNATAKLLFDCAKSINTTFCLGFTCASSALPSYICSSLKNDYSYNSDANFRLKSSYKWATWKKKITDDLDNGRPVIYGSFGLNSDAHTFICDGYRSDDKFYFNFGWGGWQDGWYAVDYIRPIRKFVKDKYGNVIDTLYHHYDVSERAIFNIYPKSDKDHCNNNATITNTTQSIPEYPTNLTVNFGNTNNTITSGKNVTYKAHNSIIIKPGFKAVAGSKFRAHIEPCANCPKTGGTSPAPRNPNVDWEGEYEEFNNISNSEGNIFVYPNPTTGIVNIEVFGNTEIQSISVFDVSGRMLQKNIAFVGNTLNLSYLIDGVYFLKIQTLSGQTTHKVIIRK